MEPCKGGTALPGRVRSIPDVLLVEFDSVLFQQGQEFLLKRHFVVVLVLIEDVFLHGLIVGLTYGKGTVSRLPVEVSQVGRLGLYPFGRALLHLLDHVGEGSFSRQGEEQVRVVGDAVDLDGGGFELVEDAAHIGVEGRADFGRDGRPALFGAEGQVGDEFRQRLGHDVPFLFRPCRAPFLCCRVPRAALTLCPVLGCFSPSG